MGRKARREKRKKKQEKAGLLAGSGLLTTVQEWMKAKPPIVISDAMIGVGRAAINAAMTAGVSVGGYCADWIPLTWPEGDKYGLTRVKEEVGDMSSHKAQRLCISAAEAVILFARDLRSDYVSFYINEAKSRHKPILVTSEVTLTGHLMDFLVTDAPKKTKTGIPQKVYVAGFSHFNMAGTIESTLLHTFIRWESALRRQSDAPLIVHPVD